MSPVETLDVFTLEEPHNSDHFDDGALQGGDHATTSN